MAPPSIPSPTPPLSGTTLAARLVAALTLGSPASGIQVPISDPPGACTRVGREAGATAPPPPALDSALGNPKGKGRGGGSRRLETPPSWGSPPARLLCAPSSPLPTLGGSDGGGSLPVDPGQGRGRAGLEGLDPQGGKLGGSGLRGFRPGRGCQEWGCLLTCWSPCPGPEMGGCGCGSDSAWCGAQGTGLGLSGPGGAIPASHGRCRRLGSAARLRLRGSAGGAGSGWGRGRGRAPPGLGLGLGAPGWLRPRATSLGLHTWRSARSEGEPWAPAAGAHTQVLTRGRPATDSCPRGRGQTRADMAHAGVHTQRPSDASPVSHLRGHEQAHSLAHAEYTRTHPH